MLGVVVDSHDLGVAAEFFELFKIPWEPAVPGRPYRVVLSAIEPPPAIQTQVMLEYGSAERALDVQAGASPSTSNGPIDLDFDGARIPLYEGVTVFRSGRDGGFLTSRGASVTLRRPGPRRMTWRVGYDLFQETRRLLSTGQPAANAEVPTLELHIAVLRRLLVDSDVTFVEVLPRPLGYDFSCCLTHDLDFFGIRRHGLDRTTAGFVSRASLGTLIDWVRGRRTTSEALKNWRALASLPFVHLGFARDFWHPVADYAQADGGHPSTYFVVPVKGRPGVSPDGSVRRRRAVRYQASEVGHALRQAAAQGSEVALHGIDAWRDGEAGRIEKAEVATLTGQARIGVRMHWLYFDQRSPQELDSAGFDYDSTCGYNDAVGYRAGTSQAFRFPSAHRLMELPLAIMDTALLFRGRMNLDRSQALQRCYAVVETMRRLGGTLVINWHDRSLAPERQWGQLYADLLHEVATRHRVWFATVGDVVEWYRWRRSIRFGIDSNGRVTLTADARDARLPGARVAVYGPSAAGHARDEASYAGDGALTIAL